MNTELQTKTTAIAKTANEHKITDKFTFDEGSQILSNIKQVSKKIKEHKEAKTKPINESLRLIRLDYKPLESLLKDTCETLEKKIVVYSDVIEADKIKKRRELQNKLVPGRQNNEIHEEIKKISYLEEKLKGNIHFRTNKEVIITDEKLVPKKYWVIDMVALRADALKPCNIIPGVEVKRNKIIAGR